MAARFDVPARLAEGREALKHTKTYVSACQLRGFQHPDLTAHGAQVQDWYDAEDGMDLRLLDGDCAELRTVVGAAEEALRVQRAQLGETAAVWRGPGADAAAAFLHSHCDAGEAVATGLRNAAEACETLRDDLWRLIDGKVNAAVGIDDRTCAQRPVWLAAAHTVTAGTGDRQAEDIVDQQVTPYVNNDIGTDWLTAMRSARASVAAAYDEATGAVASGPGIAFPIPGELGPRFQPDEPTVLAVAPVSSLDPSPAGPGPVSSVAAPPDDPVAAAPDDLLSTALGDDAGVPTGGDWPGAGLSSGGLPTGAGSLGGLIPRIADAIGGLLGSPDDGLTDPVFDDDPFGDEPDDELVDDEESGGDNESDGGSVEPDEEADSAEPGSDEPAEEVAADAPIDDVVAAPVDEQVAPPPSDQPNQQTDNAIRTPCEIAADELPQAGR
jgi:hypothetical protein